MDENMKKTYEEIGNNYRYFLTWRQAIFVGIVASLSTGMTLLFNNLKDDKPFIWVIPYILIFPVLAFWLVDVRIRSIYRDLVDAGSKIEYRFMSVDCNNYGCYTKLRGPNKERHWFLEFLIWLQRNWLDFGHSCTINWFSVISIIGMIYLGSYMRSTRFKEQLANQKELKVTPHVSPVHMQAPDSNNQYVPKPN